MILIEHSSTLTNRNIIIYYFSIEEFIKLNRNTFIIIIEEVNNKNNYVYECSTSLYNYILNKLVYNRIKNI